MKTFEKVIKGFKTLHENKNKILIILVYLAICAVIALTSWSIIALLTFIRDNLEFFTNALITIGAIAVVIWFWRRDRREKKRLADKDKEEEASRNAEAERQRLAGKVDKTYKKLCGFLFTVVRSVAANIGLVTSDRPERLYSPGKTLDAGTFTMYRFQIQKKLKEIDAQAIMDMLQDEFDSHLNANEFAMRVTSHAYKGEVYSIIQVIGVEDVGNYIHVDLAIANDAVCAFIKNREYARFEDANALVGVPEDDDF